MIFSHSVASRTLFAFVAFFQISTGAMPGVLAAAAETESEVQKHTDESMRLSKAGEDEEALVEINKAYKLVATPGIIRRKAECLLNLGKSQEALVEAKKVAKLDPENADVHSLLGTCFDALRMDTEALNEFNIAIVKRPDDRGFRAWRSKFYERHREFAKATIDLTVIIDSTEKKNRAKPLEHRANCYMILKDYPKAIADFTAASACSYGRSDLLRQRASAYDKLGNHAAAQKDMKAAGVLDEAFEPPNTLGGSK